MDFCQLSVTRTNNFLWCDDGIDNLLRPKLHFNRWFCQFDAIINGPTFDFGYLFEGLNLFVIYCGVKPRLSGKTFCMKRLAFACLLDKMSNSHIKRIQFHMKTEMRWETCKRFENLSTPRKLLDGLAIVQNVFNCLNWIYNFFSIIIIFTQILFRSHYLHGHSTSHHIDWVYKGSHNTRYFQFPFKLLWFEIVKKFC